MKFLSRFSKHIFGLGALAALLVFAMCARPAVSSAAEASYCEVVSVSGDVMLSRSGQAATPLQQGMVLLKGDTLNLAAGASADVAFDAEWKNVSRLTENTRLILRSISPVRLELVKGDVYSKLDQLPKGTSFEIKTPEAVAAVRGTKFRTTHQNGFTTVYNDSETSLVYVYHLDENGNRAGDAIVVKPGESVTIAGEAEVYDSVEDELEESRDREDQDQLNDDLNRSRPSQSEGRSETPPFQDTCQDPDCR